MKWYIPLIAAWLLTANLAAAQATKSLGPPPMFNVVQQTQPDKGHIIVGQRATRNEPVMIKETVRVGNVDMVVTRTIYRPVEVEYSVVYDVANSRVITTEGKQLPIDEVWKRCQKNTVIAISGNFETPAAVYLQALNPNILILIPSPPKQGEKK